MSHLGSIVCKIKKLNHLKQLHAQLIQNSLHNQNYWVSFLIHLSTRFHAPPSYVALIFSSTPHPDINVYTSMFKYYSHLNAHHHLFSLFQHMQASHVRPEAIVYLVLIKYAGKSGIMFHAHVVKMGIGHDPYLRNVVMDVYAKYGPIEAARELFDEMTDRSSVDWNSMISGYWKWGNEVEALRLFNVMPERNVITWTAMVTGYAKVKDLESARRYFDQIPVKSVVSWNAMLSGYAQNGYAEEALELFDEMSNAGIQPNETTWVTVISACTLHGDPCLADSLVKKIEQKQIRLNYFVKTALLDMHAKCGSLKTARIFFDELGEYRNIAAWNAMISAYARVGDLRSARELFDRIPVKNVVSWNSMIAGYAQNGQSAIAIELFKEMIATENSKPDEVTMISVISACGHLGALDFGCWLVKFLNENNMKLSISGYNSLISMYSKCGSMKDAKRIFQEMEARDVVSYNTLIAGFAAHGYGVEAIKLISEMEEEGIEPDRITYIGVLTACSHAGLLEEGHRVFKLIKYPAIDHYACMVDLFGRVGELDEAKKLIDSMPMEPHAGVLGAILNASRLHKNVELGEFAANKLFQLEPNNSGNYVLLSNIYASAGRWQDVERVREAMVKGGLKKTTGWSWVEYKGKMHKFTVGDRSHERVDDIYRLLVELRSKLRRLGYTADKSCVLRDVEEEEKEEMVGTHSEKLAICFALLVSEVGAVIRVVKNLRVCGDCHTVIKMISKLEGRVIIIRDNNRFHHFIDGQCSCKDYW
ncbi:PPR domain-containing protein/PPR_2 domain-containing protein/PPR_3 domain-containing protein/DYW_deaminase domain-containing protein [Cephalotus follicularis]|uniref:PPR domain-containing protein/PPR_2 domain-containing protein/PPR_3 domain-containing protein/DYW_deaminase domain-containing protein n=1 Tax=Cephalotus follicularis TaxID=3775 RepID=A0A1Q3CAV2_CEPFO|nr:PPR domain-containing protein/PPR_2 domain-containing protein/PPR_3 domain-containing protein/DYW_deaminase domain-containing protein [Cephalotus follicularis]